MYIAKIERDADGTPRRMLLMRTNVAAEVSRRHSNTTAVLDYFKHHPNVWIPWKTLARNALGGALAWRTRVSDARKAVEDEGGCIQWNGNARDSRYRYLRQRPLGPDAGVPRERKLF